MPGARSALGPPARSGLRWTTGDGGVGGVGGPRLAAELKTPVARPHSRAYCYLGDPPSARPAVAFFRRGISGGYVATVLMTRGFALGFARRPASARGCLGAVFEAVSGPPLGCRHLGLSWSERVACGRVGAAFGLSRDASRPSSQVPLPQSPGELLPPFPTAIPGRSRGLLAAAPAAAVWSALLLLMAAIMATRPPPGYLTPTPLPDSPT